jgi:hypothetical protein
MELNSVAWLSSLWPALLLASVEIAAADPTRFRVEGERLFYNTSIPYPDDPSTGIMKRDVAEMGLYLMEEPEVSIVVLESDGGKSAAAREMGDKIAKLGLATEVRGICESACPYIFLGGQPRTLATGGILGFHRGYVGAIEVKEFVEFRHEQHTKAINPAEYAYDRAISNTVEELKYMKRNGVNDEFMLEMLAIPPREIWMPSRAELVAAGVINAD